MVLLREIWQEIEVHMFSLFSKNIFNPQLDESTEAEPAETEEQLYLESKSGDPAHTLH